jgi:hypothetical protein
MFKVRTSCIKGSCISLLPRKTIVKLCCILSTLLVSKFLLCRFNYPAYTNLKVLFSFIKILWYNREVLIFLVMVILKLTYKSQSFHIKWKVFNIGIFYFIAFKFIHVYIHFWGYIRDNNKDIAFLLVWDKDNYTERFLVLFPYTSVLQPTLVHLYQTSSLPPGSLSIVVSASLRLLYLLLYSEDINHIQVLDLLPFAYFSHAHPPLSVWPMSNNITAFVLGIFCVSGTACNFWPSEPG